MDERPLHPDGAPEGVFQHPIKGFVWNHLGEHLMCSVDDIGEEHTEDAAIIYIGVEVHRSRCELGAWLSKVHPDPDDQITNQLFVDAVFPIVFDDPEHAETQASLKRIDLAQSVIEAGGDCTICGAKYNHVNGLEHHVGCEMTSWVMYQVALIATKRAGEPSLSQVVRAAEQQIARMQ